MLILNITQSACQILVDVRRSFTNFRFDEEGFSYFEVWGPNPRPRCLVVLPVGHGVEGLESDPVFLASLSFALELEGRRF